MGKSDVLDKIGANIGGFKGERSSKQVDLYKPLSMMIGEIHQNAIEHGWYDKFDKMNEEDCQDKLNMVLNEIQEATEDVRNNKMLLKYEDNGKPVGFPSEIADVVIRILDYMGACSHTFNDYQIECSHWDTQQMYPVQISSCLFKMSQHVADHDLVGAIRVCAYLSKRIGFDLRQVVTIKHKFNRSRSFRHGGKPI